MTILAGSMAPPIEERSIDGTAIWVPHGQRWTLLSFLRYGSCPMCNLRMRELSLALPRLEAAGIGVVVVLHSPEKRVLRYAPEALRSRVIADPSRSLYRRYGVATSWPRLLWSILLPSFYVAWVKATFYGYLGGPIDGTMAMMPADFLVAPSGRVEVAHSGAHIGDHVAVDAMIAAVSS
jgi:thioredoxin-dependent peroxiredoxin